MKKRSVKLRLTLLLTVLMAVMSFALLAFMLAISSRVGNQTAMDQLSDTVQSNLEYITYEDSSLSFDDSFNFYQNGVSILVYSSGEALLAGQLPVSFTATEAFQNGLIRTIEAGDTEYFVLDLWLADGWEDGVWIRGLMEAPSTALIARNLVKVALIILPLFLILVALGSYGIVKHSFRPLEHITSTAASINEASDLSRRIGLPPGKDEFSTLASTIDALFERLERSFESEKQFISDASHELRTPVAVIKGACEYSEKYEETPEEQKETIAMIHRQASQMSELITQLLSLTRLDQGMEKVNLQELELSGFVQSWAEDQNYNPDQLILDQLEPVQVKGDTILLARLLSNLVENGFRYGKPGGHVWISTRQKDREGLLLVRDDGIGIAPEEQSKIWERFYQVDPSRSGGKGAGLGLSMVQEIAHIHKGYMTLESIQDLGSEFTLHLPLSEKDSK